MLNRNDVKRIICDVFRTESARRKIDVLAVFETEEYNLFATVAPEVLKPSFQLCSVLFGYPERAFSSLDLMTDYAYASFARNRQITFLTSGSSATPKPCVHTMGMLEEEAYGVVPFFQGVRRIVSLVPSCHLYGFSFTVMLPHALAVPVVSLPALPAQPWDKILQEGDLLVGFPLFWNYWLQTQQHFPKGVQVLSSTSPCKDETIAGLYDAGVSYFTEIYGASETGAIAHRHHPQEYFELFPFWEVSLQDSQKPRIKRVSQNVWLDLPDQVSVQRGRFLVPLGRTDDSVQVAGINVYPKQVEKVLAAHPAVKECRVRLMRPEEGERLKAFIVLNEGYTPEHLGIIRTYLSQHLTVHEFPRSFTFGPKLPQTPLGKDADW